VPAIVVAVWPAAWPAANNRAIIARARPTAASVAFLPADDLAIRLPMSIHRAEGQDRLESFAIRQIPDRQPCTGRSLIAQSLITKIIETEAGIGGECAHRTARKTCSPGYFLQVLWRSEPYKTGSRQMIAAATNSVTADTLTTGCPRWSKANAIKAPLVHRAMMMLPVGFLFMTSPEVSDRPCHHSCHSGVSTPVAPSAQILQIGFHGSQLLGEFPNLAAPGTRQNGAGYHHDDQDSRTGCFLDKVKPRVNANRGSRRPWIYKLHGVGSGYRATGDTRIETPRGIQIGLCPGDHIFQ
jgi:hypothetical protein